MSLLEKMEVAPLCGDGAMGTELFARGIARDQCLDALCLSQPDVVEAVHRDYLDAGARIVRTNSFGANAVRLAVHGLDHHVNEINWQAAQIARQAARGRDAIVVGSVGPLGPGAAVDAAECFRTQIGALLDGGAQAIVLETFQSLAEMFVALEMKHSLHHCPVICSLAPGSGGRLPDGTTLNEAFRELLARDADVVGINCVDGPGGAVAILDALPDAPVAAFPNAGNASAASPDAFARAGAQLAACGVRLIGGCCGTTPAHIAALAAALAPESA